MNIPGLGQIPRSQMLLLALLVSLIVVAVVQVQWWIFDQTQYARAVHEQLQAIASGQRIVDAATLDAAEVERLRRAKQYAWEGAFFLTVLTACLAGVWRALYAEIRIRHRQDAFLALVSHQFKTPLASLKLAIETLMLRGALPEPQLQITGRALDDVQRLEDLINNILESARLDEGRVQLRRVALPLDRVVAQTIDRVADRARRAGAEFSLEIPAGLNALADPVAFDAVLRNILENAIASVAPLGKGQVNVLAQADAEQVKLEVSDNGVGIDPAEAPLLFQKFGFTGAAHRSGERSGLGLYICRRLMELGGGAISAHSDGLGQGARFSLTWPRAAGPGS